MAKRMLIDATHAEESRVVVLDGNTLEDFDVETSSRKQLKGNIYLAKVVRVEPSLQAAFVEYGGGRHGFLAFGEIHPDYYQIPVADRQRLLAFQAEEASAAAALDAALDDTLDTALAQIEPGTLSQTKGATSPGEIDQLSVVSDLARVTGVERPPSEASVEPAAYPQVSSPAEPENGVAGHHETGGRWRGAQAASTPREEQFGQAESTSPVPERVPEPDVPGDDQDAAEPVVVSGEEPPDPVYTDEMDPDAGAERLADMEPEVDEDADQAVPTTVPEPPPETLGGDEAETDREAADARARRASRLLRTYRIQEVIHRRQVMLVQVVKEERGTKGAALTTYISLAGRYSVLMPNSPRGGGISRKITSATDRKRLREVTQELDLPSGMGLIVRTAGANRPKPEIRRDCEYLMRLWDDIRELTLRSVAPALIYEEANLIKRSIRDVYARDIDEIIVDGDEGWRAAHEFMRQLMPSHASKVRLWRGDGGGRPSQPLFARYQVEAQLESMLNPTIQLKSGGYLVIDQTEALVAIDVNSGRSTRERNIEETAVRTNLEAADEVGRQLRLRDLAGLIVIDFIDMESRKHVAAVERRLKDALRDDRARIQVGHISHFGLLEMSRQRLRPSLAETSLDVCPHCGGTGHVRSAESSAITALRSIEDEGAKGRASVVMVHASGTVVMYLMNHKRERLAEIEQRFEMRVQFAADETLAGGQTRIERVRTQNEDVRSVTAPVVPVPPASDAQHDLEDGGTPKAATATRDAADDEMAADIPGSIDRLEGFRGAETVGSGEPLSEDAERRRRRRRRRRGGRRDQVELSGSEPGLAEANSSNDEQAEQAMSASLQAALWEDTGERLQAAAPEREARDLKFLQSGPTPFGDHDSEHADDRSPTVPSAGEPREGTRRRAQRGGKRRRSEADVVSDEQPDLPTYTGPTPSNPYGDYEGFDLLGPGLQVRAPLIMNETGSLEAPPKTLQRLTDRTTAETLTNRVEASLAEPTEVTEVQSGPRVGESVQPVLLGDAGENPRRRGWWRR